MADTSQVRSDAITETKPPVYRAIVIAPSGTVVNAMRLVAGSDEEARALAKAMVDGDAVELWDGLRFIEHFPPVD
ncbi:hypothetical protein [Methylobacterium sp. CM6247]